MSQTLPAWRQDSAGGDLLLRLHIQPGARSSGWAGVHGDALKLRLAAPPVEGKANAALIAFLAEWFGLPRNAITLESGQSSRAKRVRIAGGAHHPATARLGQP